MSERKAPYGCDPADEVQNPPSAEPICDDVHHWFELTYAQYLTIPRSSLEAMPGEWQRRFVRCLEELDAAFDWRPKEGRYWVELRTADERYAHDPLREYRHPDWGYIDSLRRPPVATAAAAEGTVPGKGECQPTNDE
jgi:hypothetical protein